MYDVKQSNLKSVADASAVEGPALSVDEPSEQLKSAAYAGAVEGLRFFRLACFRFAAGKAASPVVHDVKQSESVADISIPEFSSGNVTFFQQPKLPPVQTSDQTVQ